MKSDNLHFHLCEIRLISFLSPPLLSSPLPPSPGDEYGGYLFVPFHYTEEKENMTSSLSDAYKTATKPTSRTIRARSTIKIGVATA